MEPLLVSVADAQKLLGLSRSSLYRMMDAGEIPYVLVRRRRLIAVQALKDYIASLETV